MSDQKKENSSEEKKETTLAAEILSWVQIIVCAVAIALCMNSFIIANSRVPSASMETTIMTGDRVIGSRLTYKLFDDPERGDIIIFRWPDNEKILFVKRIIGVPGDTVEIRDGQVYRNGELLDEPYIHGQQTWVGNETESMEVEVGDDELFCMGDNREVSLDSRSSEVGNVDEDTVVGKAVVRLYPFNEITRF